MMRNMEGKIKVQYREKTAVRTQGGDVGAKCTVCGHAVKIGWEICPFCGNRLVDYCTFCGASLEPGAKECPDCGAGTSGIVCPKCGTLNFRAFCRVCNSPLTMAAAMEKERAEADPCFRKVQELAARAAELERIMEPRTVQENAGETAEAPVRHEEKEKAGVQEERTDLETEYAKVTSDINALLESMLPPAGSTPQEQRNYYSARKIAVVETRKIREPSYWICNYCGCHHNQPSECVEPQLGGKWVFNVKTVTTKSYKYSDED